MTLTMGFLGWVIIGGLAGWIGGKIMNINSFGFLLNTVVGIVGGLIGGFLLHLLGFDVETAGKIFSFFTCLLGSLIFLGILKKLESNS